MTASLVLLCLAASALIAFSTSGMVGLGLGASRPWLQRLTPAAAARVLFGAALLPFLACTAVMTAALAPSFGWVVDHCISTFDPHSHPHICARHHATDLPSFALLLLAALLAVQLSSKVTRLSCGAIQAARTSRALARLASAHQDTDVRVLPLDEPQAFVVGTLRPSLFVTRGLVEGAHREHLAPALAHERSHLTRRDPLRRAIAGLALAFHLPGLSGWLERRLARTHEMAADADAAADVGSRRRVALALVQLTRARQRWPRTAMAFAGSDVETRVAALLDEAPHADRPRASLLLGVLAMALLTIGASADAVHHGVEIVLGLFG